jgi:putative SOS response-associated peptidase YedK
MCNEVRRQIALGQVRDDFSFTRIPLYFPEGAPNLAPLDSIRITDPNAIIRRSAAAEGPGAELVVRRWSWPGPGGKPVFNMRSEGRDFGFSETGGRCLVVADGFYEHTAPADPKAKRKHKWLFTMRDEPWFCIAGLWRTTAVGEAFTLLTTEPGPDVAPYHSRQIAILSRDDWARWLDPAEPASDMLGPLAAGSLAVEQIC